VRPASIRPQRPFIGKAKKVGGKKLEIDWERIEESYNHKLNMQINNNSLAQLRQERIEAEEAGRPKAKKIRREINHLLEANLALHATWCYGCLNYLHNCKCEKVEERRKKDRERKRLARKNDREARNIARMDNALESFRQKFNIT
jgi:hypothetical protein